MKDWELGQEALQIFRLERGTLPKARTEVKAKKVKQSRRSPKPNLAVMSGMYTQKRAALLLEILIALSLAAVLLTCLFSFFVESVKLEKRLETARETVMARAHLQTRLQTILSAASSLHTEKVERENCLFIEFDNQIDPDPSFSGSLSGRIYLDDQKNLLLLISPTDPLSKSWRKEILLKNVEKAEFEFLTTQSTWIQNREKGTAGIPQMIRLTVSTPEPLQFAFHLPNPEPFVTYREEPCKF